MKLYNILLFITSLFFLFVGCSNPFNQTPKRNLNDNYFKGIVFTNYSRTGYVSDSAQVSLNHLKSTGGDWIGIIKTYYQLTYESDSIFIDSLKTPDSASLDSIIRMAKQAGFKVFVIPHVDSKDKTWRGLISPTYISAWFKQYINLLKDLADQCQRLNVDLLSIGCELKSISQDDYWNNLIDTVRNYYKGALIYCANDNSGGLETARANLARFMDQTGRWVEKKPVIITEIGYPSSNSAIKEPWSYSMNAQKDWQQQADCFRIALETVPHREWFAGMFFWEWEAVTYQKAYETGFNPRGKKAEAVLKEFWKK
jgi:hypothetical protein